MTPRIIRSLRSSSARWFPLKIIPDVSKNKQRRSFHASSASYNRSRRVVVTGMGAVTPLGGTLQESWKKIVAGKCGITTLEEALLHQNLPQAQFDREWKIAQTLPCQVAAAVRNVQNDARTARFVQLALLASAEAMETSKLLEWLEQQDESKARDSIGVCVGSGMSGVREINLAMNTIESSGSIRKLSPHFIPKVLTNSAAGRLSLEYQLRGPNLAPSTACAAGSHAIGDAFRAIQYGTADIMLCGGTEAAIEPLGLAGFCRLRALSTGFAVPEESSRPFDAQRDGFVMGEGAAVLVLEELEHAKARGAKILAEMCGYGISGDAFHITAPDGDGWGAERAMRMALEDADATMNSSVSSKLGYINAHATSTPKGDEIEATVIDRLLQLQDKLPTVTYVSSTKGATGHLLGAAGAIEAAITVQSLVKQHIPPTLNLEDTGNGDDELAFEHVPQQAIMPTCDIEVAMSNSFGFGGTNSSLVFCKYDGT